MKVINRKPSVSNAESVVMGERGLLILLLAGFCVPAYNQIRKYVFVGTVKSWSEAQSYCREKHTDLATVCSQEEAQQLLTITGASLWDSLIGLYRDDTQNWQWSNSDDVIYSNWRATEAQQYCREHHTDLVSIKSASENEGENYTFHNWNYWEPNNWRGGDNCVAMSKTGEWFDIGCNRWISFCCEGEDPVQTVFSFNSV
ncbi:C-type mannose receptor 2-like [Acipenser oxyrinchus oxyrinchus]|uniref:C-type mannose receptor 2-like n=1 Tax=Acipenser oxyrinchus oxyrinchus TaxID=40147 RepID=A0AAD8FQ73_ACIOX|nr:C-type mannose receptor 2-like [Acipenser oxyrinchus oxyrinchus]